ncbi:hypothetical protein C7S18_14345 [Ahniella affigens]|uniref:Protein kinase domain-containing protein n=1 Tax=Ahniella affigens TaxID=2021234 RepID=A0A2P1PTZ0_9GAMM|nr:hypothetical protein C7S18_14345 [Ahniella affigens]
MLPPAPIEAVLEAILIILDALQLAQPHLIVRRDINPENIGMDVELRNRWHPTSARSALRNF